MTKQLGGGHGLVRKHVAEGGGEGVLSMAWQSGDGLISQLVESQLSQSVEVLVII